jgi:hypothetical protein
MEYQVAVRQGKFDVTGVRLGYLIHQAGKKKLEGELKPIPYPWSKTLSFSSVTLTNRIRKFSEQFVGDAELELSRYLRHLSGRPLAVDYPDLLYFGDKSGSDYYFNKSVAAAIGEGMAGLIVQKLFGHIPKARPLGLSPDIIMEHPVTGEIALVEAKALLKKKGRSINEEVRKAALEMMDFLARAPYLKKSKYAGYVVGTEIPNTIKASGRIELDCYVLRMEQP